MFFNKMDKIMSSSSHLNTQNMYSKVLSVRLTNSKSDEKFKNINISVDYQTTTVPQHKTELIIKLTDELDPFFLYSLYMSEEDYQILKTQQGLLVDFNAFGQKFIDLLNLCEKDERLESPKFQLQLYTKEPLPFDHNNASLNVIEINPFKHLCHLQLNFMPGNDSDVKKYLANCLKQLRENYTKLNREHDETKANLTQRLESTQQLLSQKSTDLDRIRIEIETQNERLNTKYMQEINFEKEKSLQSQYALQQKYEKEKKDSEANFYKLQNQLEQRLNELEVANKDLIDKKYKNEVQLQEIRSKFGSLQDEYNVLKQDLTTIRKQNTNLDSELHTNEKTVNHLRTRIAVLEQEVKDKDELVQRTQELLNNEQALKKQAEEMSNDRGNEIKKLHGSLKHVSGELMKGNDIINKLQTKLRTCNNKMKIKNEILNQQEKVVLDKEKELADCKNELKSLQDNLKQLNDENKDLKNAVSKKTQELEEAAKLLKKDENIINWLNKQITELNMSNNGHVNGNLMNTAPGGLQFKPYGALSTNLISPQAIGTASTTTTTNAIVSLNNTRNGFINNSMDYMNGTNGTASGNGVLLRSASLNKNFNQSTDFLLNEQPQRFNSSNHMMTSSTTNATLQAPITTATTTTTLVSNNYAKTLNSSSSSSSSSAQMQQQQTTQANRLDPKYFQPQSGTVSVTSAVTVPTTTSQMNSDSLSNQLSIKTRLNNMNTAANTNANAVRINKQIVTQQQQQQQQQQQGINNISPNSIGQITNGMGGMNMGTTSNYAALIQSKSQPALASAYFPAN